MWLPWWHLQHRLKSKNTEISSPERARQYALRLLAARDYTSARLRDKLTEKNYSSNDAECVIQQLKSEGWIDDRRFAQRFAESASASGRFCGPRLRQEMRRRGLPDDVVNDMMGRIREEYDEVAGVTAILERRYPDFPRSPGNDKEKQRIIGFLQRRGFNISVIMHALREITNNEIS